MVQPHKEGYLLKKKKKKKEKKRKGRASTFQKCDMASYNIYFILQISYLYLATFME